MRRKLLLLRGKAVGIAAKHARDVLLDLLRRNRHSDPLYSSLDFMCLTEVEELAIRFFLRKGNKQKFYVEDESL